MGYQIDGVVAGSRWSVGRPRIRQTKVPRGETDAGKRAQSEKIPPMASILHSIDVFVQMQPFRDDEILLP
jgi:hypothetical protein